MKKLVSLILVTVLMLGLVACGGSGEGSGETPKGEYSALKVGFYRSNFTPDYPVALSGYDSGNSRISSGFLDYLYVTCVAFREGDETILMFTLDLAAATTGTADELRKAVEKATGIPAEKQYYGATHSHSTPGISATVTGGTQTRAAVTKAAVESATKALEDLAPAKPYHTAFNAGDMAFCRNYVTVNESTGEQTYLNESDSTMVLLKFDREEKKDILMVNFGSHPDHSNAIGFNNISADFPGALREKIIKETGMEVAYFTAASGDQTPFSQIKGDNLGITMQEYGQRLADHAIANLPNLQPVEGSGIVTKNVIYKAEVDHHLDSLVREAQIVYDAYQASGNNLAATRELAQSYGLQSAYEARAVLTRAQLGPTIDMETNAIRIGGIGFITGTYEMYAESGKYVRDNDPYEASFIIMGNNSYVASEAAFDIGTYEAVTGLYAKGTAEKMAEHYVQLLKDIQ